ncbi:site-2 protease family protein [Alicyclobacillus sendaiensis]|uniref:Site-2 protease family protein n=1 Tax=Alicyclobacillus sendaiensis PA2 TaxID=3029425 RepID=A0ABT6Y1U3_ALISE|nr:site-2 protease family protein [Alicyclobacillus sendaiensis]MDI9261326.1 site-2 protease family protein [Alicyclobacillus sendaiensis PA2]
MSYSTLIGLSFALAVLSHELGHACAAWLVGVRVRRFRYGWGPVLLKLGVLEWRLVPIAGAVETEAADGWRGFVIALGGVFGQWIAWPVVEMLSPLVGAWFWLLCVVGTVRLMVQLFPGIHGL